MQLHAEPVAFIGFDDADLFEIGGGLKATLTFREGAQHIFETFVKFVIPHLDTGYFWQDLLHWFFDVSVDTGTHWRTWTLTLLGNTFSLGFYWDN